MNPVVDGLFYHCVRHEGRGRRARKTLLDTSFGRHGYPVKGAPY